MVPRGGDGGEVRVFFIAVQKEIRSKLPGPELPLVPEAAGVVGQENHGEGGEILGHRRDGEGCNCPISILGGEYNCLWQTSFIVADFEKFELLWTKNFKMF
jgi:hypothetical protein